MDSLAFELLLASAVIHAGWNLAARRASGDFSAIWLGLLLSGAAASGAAAWAGAAPARASWALLAASAALNAAYFVTLSSAYRDGEIAVVYPIARGTGLACAVLGSALLLGEPLSTVGLAGAALVCLGILSLGGGASLGHAARAALLCGLSSGICSLCDKIGVARTHPTGYLGGQYLLSVLLLAPVAWARRGDGRLARAGRVAAGLCVGFGSLAAYLMALFAYRRAPLGYAAPVRELSLVLGALGGRVFLGEPIPPTRLRALAAIVAGIVLIRLA